MAFRSQYRACVRPPRAAWRAAPLLMVLVLSGCLSSSAPSGLVAFRLLGASIAVSPTSYSGSCGQRQSFTYTATLTAVGGHRGGTAHYRWRIGSTSVEGDLVFSPGQEEQLLTQTLALDNVQPDQEPLVRATIATTAPNTVASPELVVRLPCTTPLQIESADLLVSPSSAGCGSSTFSFSALLSAPEGNVGGDVRYTWHFLNGATTSGVVTFTPGQLNATVFAAVTYFVTFRQTRQVAQILPVATISTRTPTPKPTARPTHTPTAAPLGTPALPGEVGAWLSVESPTALRTDTTAPSFNC